MKRPYYLIQRNGIWYYRLNKESGLVEQDEKTWHSTGIGKREDAESYVREMLGGSRELPTFRDYASPFFVWGECPHIRRVLEENGHYTERHARIQRGRLENHVLSVSAHLNSPFSAHLITPSLK